MLVHAGVRMRSIVEGPGLVPVACSAFRACVLGDVLEPTITVGQSHLMSCTNTDCSARTLQL